MEQPYYALWIATASYALRVLCCSLCVAWRGVAGISRGVLAMNGSPGPSVSLNCWARQYVLIILPYIYFKQIVIRHCQQCNLI